MKSNYVLFILLIGCILPDAQSQADVFFRSDYRYIKDVNSFYKLHTQKKKWIDARTKCEWEGATLFYPEDEDEAALVIGFWNETQPFIPWVYIGVADWNVKEVFDTIDGRSIDDVYHNWYYGEPNNADGEEGCVVLRMDGTLNDDNCANRHPFICKKTQGTVQWNKRCDMPDIHYHYHSDIMDRCYKFHLTPKTWSESYAICNAEQSYLAVIDSNAEAAHLVNITALAPKDKVIGDYLRGAVHLGFKNSNEWITIKGEPLHQSGYNKWGYGQPDGGENEKCGSMFHNGELNDISCSEKLFFICEHEIRLRSEEIGYRFGD